MEGREMSLTGHLGELRRVLIASGLALMGCSLITFLVFGDWLFLFFVQPLKDLAVPVIAIRVGEAFLTKVRISLLGGFVLAFPLIMWQVGSFILPALNKQERRLAIFLFPVSIVLFAAGLAFAYFTVFPLAVRFLLLVATGGLTPMITVREYVSFVVAFFIPFGLIFELPLVIYLLARLGLVTPPGLMGKRKYVLLLTFVLAAFLTPGADVISQIMMAVPMLVLYEISIGIAYVVHRRAVGRSRLNFSSPV